MFCLFATNFFSIAPVVLVPFRSFHHDLPLFRMTLRKNSVEVLEGAGQFGATPVVPA
jgi:hypothetical protein